MDDKQRRSEYAFVIRHVLAEIWHVKRVHVPTTFTPSSKYETIRLCQQKSLQPLPQAPSQ